MPNPMDSTARMNNYISYDADWIKFETIISTESDQIAIAPGYLEKSGLKTTVNISTTKWMLLF